MIRSFRDERQLVSMLVVHAYPQALARQANRASSAAREANAGNNRSRA
jgi:hypothetical protein